MGILDIILLAIVGALVVFAVISGAKRKKRGASCCGCSSCAGCPYSKKCGGK